MVSKGIASVRSPVKNLRDFGAEVEHGTFVDAVIDSFKEHYGVTGPVRVVGLTEHVRQSLTELRRSWSMNLST